MYSFFFAVHFCTRWHSFRTLISTLYNYTYSSRKSSATQSYALFFHVSVVHRYSTWTTGSLACVHDQFYACVYTHGGWAHRQCVSTLLLTHVLLTGFELGSWNVSPTFYQLSHPPPILAYSCAMLTYVLSVWSEDVQLPITVGVAEFVNVVIGHMLEIWYISFWICLTLHAYLAVYPGTQ